jgi:hypothetical protein
MLCSRLISARSRRFSAPLQLPLAAQLRRRLRLVEEEQEQALADPDLVAVPEQALFDRQGIDVGPLRAAQIAQPELLAGAPDEAVFRGHRRIIDDQQIGGTAPDGDFLLGQREEGALQRSGDGKEPGIHP